MITARARARLTGVLYLLIFAAAPSGGTNATPIRMFLTLACDTGVAYLLYGLLRPADGSLSLLAACYRAIFVAVMAANSIRYFGVTGLLQGDHSTGAFDSGYEAAVVFFGLHCVLIGTLILRSRFLPRVLGVLMAIAGFGWLVFLSPPLAHRLWWCIVGASLLGEGSLTLWLLIAGVNPERWNEQASTAGHMALAAPSEHSATSQSMRAE